MDQITYYCRSCGYTPVVLKGATCWSCVYGLDPSTAPEPDEPGQDEIIGEAMAGLDAELERLLDDEGDFVESN